MGSGFSNPLVGGSGGLVYPSIHSPGFSVGPPVVGWSIDKNGNAFLGNVVIAGTFQGTDFVINAAGAFFYSPSIGAGNLVASIAATSGMDAYNNTYLAGIVSYSAIGSALLEAGSLELIDTLANSWALQPFNVAGTPYLAVRIPSGFTASYINGAGYFQANQPLSPGTPETWHSLSLNAGFAALAGFAAPRYRLEPMGSGGVVRLDGAVSLTANHAVGTAIATLPASYQPSFSHYFLTGNSLSGGVGGQVESVRVINATGGGFLELGSAGSNGNYVLLEGITFPLD